MQFEQAHVDAIARALGDTEDGLSGTEIAHLLSVCRMETYDPSQVTKWKCIQTAFAMSQNARGNRTAILEFIRQAMNPAITEAMYVRPRHQEDRGWHETDGDRRSLLLMPLKLSPSRLPMSKRTHPLRDDDRSPRLRAA